MVQNLWFPHQALREESHEEVPSGRLEITSVAHIYLHFSLGCTDRNDWLVKNAYLTGIATMKATDFLNTFVTYPPSQKPATFTVDQVRKSVDEQIERLAKQDATAASRVAK